MTSNLASNALYRKYKEEKALLETYGHVSSLTYEEWLETKKTNKTMKSTIEWQTGTPIIGGEYLVCLKNKSITTDKFLVAYGLEGDWKRFNKSYVVAWLKLSDIEPYKEKEE